MTKCDGGPGWQVEYTGAGQYIGMYGKQAVFVRNQDEVIAWTKIRGFVPSKWLGEILAKVDNTMQVQQREFEAKLHRWILS